MKLTTILSGTVVALSIPFAAQAQNVETYEDYRVSCNATSECNQFDVIYQEEGADNNEIAQRRRTRRSRESDKKKNYIGVTGGLFFPGGIGDVGFGPSVVGGRQFNDNLSGEVEFLFYGGGTDFDDLGYNILGFIAGAKYLFPFSDSSKSPYGFAGAGLGFGRIALTGDEADRLDNAGFDTSDGAFLFQLKGGVGYPVSKNIDIFGQFRYLNVTIDTFNRFGNVGTGSVNGDGFSLDFGANFKF